MIERFRRSTLCLLLKITPVLCVPGILTRAIDCVEVSPVIQLFTFISMYCFHDRVVC
jgi:hypothetical protein